MLAVYRSDLGISETYARRSVEIRTAAYGADDPRIAYAVDMLGGALRRLGRIRRRASATCARRSRSTSATKGRMTSASSCRCTVSPTRWRPIARITPTPRASWSAASRSRRRRSAKAIRERRTRSSFSAPLESRRGNFAKAERLSRLAVEIFDRTFGDTTSRWPTPTPISRRSTRAPAGGPTPRRRSAPRSPFTKTRSDARTRRMAARSEGSARSTCTPVGSPRPRRNAARRSRFASARWEASNLALLNPLMLLGDIRAQRGELDGGGLALLDRPVDHPRACRISRERTRISTRAWPRCATSSIVPSRRRSYVERAGGKPVTRRWIFRSGDGRRARGDGRRDGRGERDRSPARISRRPPPLAGRPARRRPRPVARMPVPAVARRPSPVARPPPPVPRPNSDSRPNNILLEPIAASHES